MMDGDEMMAMGRTRRQCTCWAGCRECIRPEDFSRAALLRNNSIGEICLTCPVYRGEREAPVDTDMPEQLGLFVEEEVV